nr:Zn-ribbon domain-containing OB-fold protein [Candidatus Sigynarchaeota archaeon]
MADTKEILQENYLAFLKDKKLMGSKCSKCQHVDLPPRKICSKCHAASTSWVDLTGMTGTLSTFSCVHVGTQKFIDRGFSGKNPYAFGVVTLDNGASLTGFLQGVDPKKPDSIKIGMKMKVTFIETPSPSGLQVDVGFMPV